MQSSKLFENFPYANLGKMHYLASFKFSKIQCYIQSITSHRAFDPIH
jgi:hypothetical protein